MLLVTLLIVFAMGLQNTFSRLYGKETFGPTTVMTGTVTQAALDLLTNVTARFTDESKRESLKKQAVLMAGFLVGCLLGAVTAKPFGLTVVILPGLLLIVLFSNTTPVAKAKNTVS